MERFVTGVVRPPPVARVGRPQVRIVTLGRFAVEVDGAEVPTSTWGSRRARTLCKRLVVARGWPVTRDELVELLWPDELDDRRLGARLSVQLSSVRRVLGGGVVADRSTVALDLDEVSTDLEDLLRASDDRAIVDVFTGELLPEDRYEDWTVPVRRETASRFAAAARRLAESALADGDHLRAVELAQRVLALDRYDEAAHRVIVRALVAAGELGRAREAHDDLAAALAELGIEAEPFDPARHRQV
jgi:DNA-binding SARP family transcriptional activator